MICMEARSCARSGSKVVADMTCCAHLKFGQGEAVVGNTENSMKSVQIE